MRRSRKNGRGAKRCREKPEREGGALEEVRGRCPKKRDLSLDLSGFSFVN